MTKRVSGLAVTTTSESQYNCIQVRFWLPKLAGELIEYEQTAVRYSIRSR